MANYDSDEDQSRRTDSSYYSFNGHPASTRDPNSTYIRRRDADRQMEDVPDGARRPYPSRYSNYERLPLSSDGIHTRTGRGWLHAPLRQDEARAWTPRDGSPGAVRGIYTEGNPNNYDVAYHDPDRPVRRGRHAPMTMANYHPRATSEERQRREERERERQRREERERERDRREERERERERREQRRFASRSPHRHRRHASISPDRDRRHRPGGR